MVVLLHDQALDAVHIGRLPRRVVGDRSDIADVLKTVALHIGLGEHHEAVFVAQLVEARVVGVMRGAHGVDVVALHELHIAAHALQPFRTELVVVAVVAIHAVHLEVDAVEQDATILDRDLGESLAARYDL